MFWSVDLTNNLHTIMNCLQVDFVKSALLFILWQCSPAVAFVVNLTIIIVSKLVTFSLFY